MNMRHHHYQNASRALVAFLAISMAFAEIMAQDSASPSGDKALPKFAIKRFGSLRFLPHSTVDRIEYSANGRYVASIAIPRMGHIKSGVQIWERNSGRDVTPLSLRNVPADDVSWGPDARRFVTCHDETELETTLNVWTVGTDLPQPLQTKEKYLSVDWSPAGDRIAVRALDGATVVYTLDGREQFRWPNIKEDQVPKVSKSIDFSPDGQLLAAIASNGITIYDAAKGTSTVEIVLSPIEIWSIRFLSDSRSIGVAYEDGVRIYNLDHPEKVALSFETGATPDFSVSQDSNWLAVSGTFSSRIGGIWNFKTGEKVYSSPERIGGGVAFSPDQSEVATTTRRISFLKVPTWEPHVSDPNDAISSLTTGLQRKQKVWVGGLGASLRELDLDSGKTARIFRRPAGYTNRLSFVDDHQLAVAGDIETIDLLDTDSEKWDAQLAGHATMTIAIASVPGQQRLISAGLDDTFKCWDLTTKNIVYEIKLGEKSQISELQVSPNGHYLAVGEAHYGYILMRRTKDGSAVWFQPGSIGFSTILFSSGSRHFAAPIWVKNNQGENSHEAICFWNSTSGQEIARKDFGSTGIGKFAISPDGKTLAHADLHSDNYSIDIRNLTRNQRIGRLTGHLDSVRWLEFTPDGRQLISLSHDTTAILWDIDALVNSL